MGRMKDLMMEMQDQADDRQLAKLLGIKYQELTSLEYQIEEDKDSEGMIYQYRVEFGENNPKELMRKIKNLEDGVRVYLDPHELEENYNYLYDEEFEAILGNKNYYRQFKIEMSNIIELNNIEIKDAGLNKILKRQIFISVISTLEMFLSNTFIHLISDNQNYFRNFIESHPEFRQQKFELREIFKEMDALRGNANRVMLDTIYHNLPIVKKMYESAFAISFPDIKNLYRSVLTRHDLVHRNGKTKDGQPVEINSKIIEDLIEEVKIFVREIVLLLKLE